MTWGKLRVQVVYRAGLDLRKRLLGQPRNVLGSDLLRLQTGTLMRPHLPPGIDLRYTHFGDGRWNFDRWLPFQGRAIYILLKSAAYAMTAEQIARLRKRAIAVGVDHKDGDLARIDLGAFDFHIASSEAGRSALERLLGDPANGAPAHAFVGILYQSPDARLGALSFTPLDRLSAVYVGLRKNSLIPNGLMREIDVFEVVLSQDMTATLPHLPRYNFHFAVRPPSPAGLRREYKPFTKGMTAAVCQSNILVNTGVDDAMELLTPDYPYLIDGNAPEIVEATFRRASEDFGGPDWNRGLDIMAHLRAKVSAQALADQFVHILHRVAR